MSDHEIDAHDRSSVRIEHIVDKRINKRTKRIENTICELADQLRRKNDRSKKEASKPKISWNREGHRIQHEFLMETLDMLSDIEEDIDSGVHRDDCIEKVQTVKRSVKYRSKLIRMADQEEGGWETVKAYERSSIADDDKDDRKIKNAVATAKRKLCERS